MLRRKRTLILTAVTAGALILVLAIGLLSRGGGGGELRAGGDVVGSTILGSSDAAASTDSTASFVATGSGADSAAPSSTVPDADAEADQALRVTSTVSQTVQICHSNYGGCVPVAADVDCEGDGDGPAFQTDEVAVFGDDVYELDTDDDRTACEPGQPPASDPASGSG